MTRDEFYILNSIYNGSRGRASVRADIGLTKALRNWETVSSLRQSGYISADGNITPTGYSALEPYRVNNAVILAAGASTRFIPLSLEMPKGLFEVKGEPLIERQICQLREAGITDITVVLGYKKDMFMYLKDKYGVSFIFNPSFNVKNNIESIWLARQAFGSTYLCVSDSYYIENPFNQYEFEAFNSGVRVETAQSEIYAETDASGRIVNIYEGGTQGTVMLGHAYWTREFSDAFFNIAEREHDTGKYDKLFWEWLVSDSLEELPPFMLRQYAPGEIFEFDYFEELREFDTNYLGHTHSNIIRNIKLVFRCDEEDIRDFRNVSEGLTNISFIFKIGGTDYIYRHPGDGTENIINRRHEKESLIRAKEAGIDPTYIYMDINEGWKISEFVSRFREPDYESFEDSKLIIRKLRQLHASGITTDYGMKPWEDAEAMEALLKKQHPDCFAPYEELKSRIFDLYSRTLGDGVEKCFCHGDTYRHNWMILPDSQVYLIDWEYSGMSDPGIDVGYYIVDAMYDYDRAKQFIGEYLGEKRTDSLEFHYLAYVAIIAWYWFVWALYRESCGADIGEEKDNWLAMAEKYSAPAAYM